jgi:hypothetical protein
MVRAGRTTSLAISVTARAKFGKTKYRKERMGMKLTIKRNQADVKGFFGGHKGVLFSVYAKADITQEERALIDRYKVGEWVLATREIMIGKNKHEINLTVNTLINGNTATMANLADLQKWEEDIKTSCVNLKNALAVMATFGGEEIIEI